MQYATDGRRKFVWQPHIDRGQFFDLEQDPDECHNLIAEPDRRGEIAQWHGYRVQELATRECGRVQDGKPFCPPDEPLVSPQQRGTLADERLRRAATLAKVGRSAFCGVSSVWI